MALISAHRCGAGDDLKLENTRIALERAVALDCEYVEFDVQRCADGTFVLFHDAEVLHDGTLVRIDELTFEQFAGAASQFMRYEAALALLRGRKRAHIDLKFVSPPGAYDDPDPAATYEVQATQLAIEALGANAVIVTTLEDQSVRALRRWGARRYPGLLVGLALGRDLTGHRRLQKARTRRQELFPRRRIADSGANLVVAHQRLADLNLARFANGHGVRLLVWTVDHPADLERWLADPRVWMITTNFPRRALEIRGRLAASRVRR